MILELFDQIPFLVLNNIIISFKKKQTVVLQKRHSQTKSWTPKQAITKLLYYLQNILQLPFGANSPSLRITDLFGQQKKSIKIAGQVGEGYHSLHPVCQFLSCQKERIVIHYEVHWESRITLLFVNAILACEDYLLLYAPTSSVELFLRKDVQSPTVHFLFIHRLCLPLFFAKDLPNSLPCFLNFQRFLHLQF